MTPQEIWTCIEEFLVRNAWAAWSVTGLLILHWSINLVLKSKLGRDWLRQLMTWEGHQTIYARNVQGILKRIDRCLLPPKFYPVGVRDALRTSRDPFGWSLYDRALLLAVIYPMFALIILWIFGLGDGRVGSLPLLSNALDWCVRPVAFGVIALFASSFMLLGTARLVLQLVALVAALEVAFALATAGGGVVALVFAVTLPFALAFALATTGSFALALALPFGLLNASAQILDILPATAMTVTLPFAFTLPFALAVSVALAVALAAANAVRLGMRCGPASGTFAGFSLAMAGMLGVAAWPGPINEDFGSLFLFLGVLPLVNAVFDFGSVGLTRWLLREGVRRPAWAFPLGLVDGGAALSAFIGLGTALILAVQGLNWLNAGVIFNLEPLFTDLRQGGPGVHERYAWLYLMIFSTLLPTCLHMVVAAWSMITWIPHAFRDWVPWLLDRLLNDNDTVDRLVKYALEGLLIVMIALSLILPAGFIALLLLGLTQIFPDLGSAYLSLFEYVAAWAGVAITPTPIEWVF